MGLDDPKILPGKDLLFFQNPADIPYGFPEYIGNFAKISRDKNLAVFRASAFMKTAFVFNFLLFTAETTRAVIRNCAFYCAAFASEICGVGGAPPSVGWVGRPSPGSAGGGAGICGRCAQRAYLSARATATS